MKTARCLHLRRSLTSLVPLLGLLVQAAANAAGPSISTIPNQNTTDAATVLVQFRVTDPDTPAGSLAVDATVVDQTLVPSGSFRFTNAGEDRTLSFTTAPNRSGRTLVTVSVTDGTQSAFSSFEVAVVAANAPPTVSPIADLATDESIATTWVEIDLADSESAAESLELSGEADNSGLVPSSNFEFEGSGSLRRFRVFPAPFASGTTLVRIVATDPAGGRGSAQFTLTVNAVDTAPEVSPLRDAAIYEGSTYRTSIVTFDAETPAEKLRFEVNSSNPALLDAAGVSLSPPAVERTLTLTPKPAQFGTTRVEVAVTDEAGQTTRSAFTLTVKIVNQPPTIDLPLTEFSWVAGGAVLAIPFTVTDRETAAGSLVVGAASSAPDVVAPSQIVVSGTGANRALRVQPTPGAHGSTRLAVFVRDAHGSLAAHRFDLHLATTPAAPGATPAADDFNADGWPDLVYQHDTGYVAVSFTRASQVVASAFVAPALPDPSGYLRAVATADFNQDGWTDLCLMDAAGRVEIWEMRGLDRSRVSGFDLASLGNAAGSAIRGAGDFVGDTGPDLLLEGQAGDLAVLEMTGTVPGNVVPIARNTGDPHWHAAGVADLDADSKSDILFQHDDASLSAWLMDGTRVVRAQLLEPSSPGDASWRARAMLDLDRDGYQDLVFQSADGTVSPWLMEGLRLKDHSLLRPPNPGPGWQLVGPR